MADTETTRPLEDILQGGRESAQPAGEGAQASQAQPEAKSEPTADPAPKPAAQAQGQGQDDDPDKHAVDVAGQKMVPLTAVTAEREKGKKRYTETVASFEKKLEDQNRSWDQRFNKLFGVIQQQQPRPQQQQPTPQPQPDFYENPDAAVAARVERELAPVVRNVTAMQEMMSRQFAVRDHGAETVQAAYESLDKMFEANPHAAEGEKRRIMSSPDPWGELVKWHKQQSALAEIGSDPAAYREKLKAELLAELKGSTEGQPAPQPAAGQPQQQQPPAAQPAPVMPSNLAGARSAGPRSGPAWSGPASLQDIFDRAQKPKH